ncbi:MAG: gliding motility-associated C-terminal domain-containing protein, partial [Taibaiella sp.]|nr:gliding motility-associated C-terminal domain-containing protein [Taibaiella sp.]
SEVCGALYYDTFVVMLRPDSLSEGISPMETEVCSGALLTFTSNGDHTATYLWRNERGQILGTEASIQSNVYYPGKVYLDETTRDGCTYTDSVTFTTYPCCDLLVPNSFSPNGDGLNDAFGIVAEADKRIELLHIYNRYGQLVYKSTEMYDRWDGTYLGAPLPVGVYYYVLQYRCYSADESLHTMKGDITLMR